jgi:hypothetical protein
MVDMALHDLLGKSSWATAIQATGGVSQTDDNQHHHRHSAGRRYGC